MATAAPPKPWEQAENQQQQPVASTSAAGATTGPSVPTRPAEIGSSVVPLHSNSALSPYSSSPYSTSPYGSALSPYGGGTSSYSSPYSRLSGGYGSTYGGGYSGLSSYGGGYGGGYGGYGGGMGMGGYGGAMGGYGGMGYPGQEGLPPSFSSSLAQSTSPAFSLLEGFVTSITSLAQLLESTYMATHSSFFALAGVADQLGSAKLYLGQILGVFSVLRWGKGFLAWIKGGGQGGALSGGMTDWGQEFAALGQGLGQPLGQSRNGAGPVKRPSSKPLLFFLLTAVGLPFAMAKLIRLLTQNMVAPPPQGLAGAPGASPAAVPSDLTFVRATHRFEPKDAMELALAEGEIVAVLEKLQGGADGAEGQWWRGRTRDGRVGWFPRTFVTPLPKPAAAPTSAPSKAVP